MSSALTTLPAGTLAMLERIPPADLAQIAKTVVGTVASLYERGAIEESKWQDVHRRGQELQQESAFLKDRHEGLMSTLALVEALPEDQRAAVVGRIVDAVCELALRPPGAR
ncbi:MAG: hypothetical protein H6737_06955 [Alphaproteobacteria bacterium]|nr:hypothetical protein [Alphaproteobacteria bacterium]